MDLGSVTHRAFMESTYRFLCETEKKMREESAEALAAGRGDMIAASCQFCLVFGQEFL